MSDNLKDIQNRFLKDTVAKHEHGTVYGNLGGVVANHEFKKYPIKEDVSLEDYIKALEKKIEKLQDNDKILKSVILSNEKRIEQLERIVNKYGII